MLGRARRLRATSRAELSPESRVEQVTRRTFISAESAARSKPGWSRLELAEKRPTTFCAEGSPAIRRDRRQDRKPRKSE